MNLLSAFYKQIIQFKTPHTSSIQALTRQRKKREEMKKLFGTAIVIIFCALISQAQDQDIRTSINNSQKTSVSNNHKEIQLESGTQLFAQLQSAIDVRKIKEGDQVILKTSKDIKTQGEVVIKQGATILGRVTQAQKKSKNKDLSSLSLVFDKLENGSLSMPLHATLTSIMQAAVNTSPGDDLFATSGNLSAGNTTSTRSQNSGGLLGGVTNTVSGVVNTTTQGVGGALNTTTDTVGRTTGTVSNTLSGIQISQATGATVEGGSTLSLAGDNLRLEKGTTFLLLLQSASKAETKAGKKAAKRESEGNP
jgi:hypothetical protein